MLLQDHLFCHVTGSRPAVQLSGVCHAVELSSICHVVAASCSSLVLVSPTARHTGMLAMHVQRSEAEGLVHIQRTWTR